MHVLSVTQYLIMQTRTFVVFDQGANPSIAPSRKIVADPQIAARALHIVDWSGERRVGFHVSRRQPRGGTLFSESL